MNGRRVFLFLILFISAVALSDGPAPTEPGLQSEEDKVQFLLYLQHNLPEIFNQAPRYRFSVMALLEDQSKLETLLSQDPQFQKLAALRSPLMRLQAQPVTQGTFKGFRIKSEAVAQWRGKLLGVIDRLTQSEGAPSTEADFAESVLKRIVHLRKLIGSKGLNGALVGLIQGLPAEAKAKIFKAPTAEAKIELLIAGNADPTAIARLKILAGQEEELRLLPEAFVAVMNEPPHTTGGTIGEVRQKLARLSAKDLEFLADKDGLSSRVEALDGLLVSQGQRPKSGDMLTDIRKHLLEFSSQTEATVENIGKGLTLEEQPPRFSIFRGCPGGDCSTAMSFAAPNAPTERVFYIYDDHHVQRGYLEGTVIQLPDGTKGFYLSCINGSALSSSDTLLLMNAMNEARNRLGVSQILLPEESSIRSLVNFVPIQEAFFRLIRGRKSVKMQHLDSELRIKIENFESGRNRADYDSMSSNQKGVPFEKSADFPEIKVAISVRALPTFHQQPLTDDALIHLCLYLRALKLHNEFERVMGVGKLKRERVQAAWEVVENQQGLSVAEYRTKLASHSLADLENVGWLRTRDAMSPQHSDQTVATLIGEIEGSELHSAVPRGFFNQNQDQLLDHPKFQKWLGALPSEGDEGAQLLDRLLRLAPELPIPAAITEEALKMTQSEKIETAREGLQLLRALKSKDPRATEAAIGRLEHPALWEEALSLLEVTQPKDARLTAAMLKGFLGTNDKAQLRWLDAMTRLGLGSEEGPIAQLIPYLNSDRHFRVARIIEQSNIKSEKILNLLKESMQAENPNVRYFAARVFRKLNPLDHSYLKALASTFKFDPRFKYSKEVMEIFVADVYRVPFGSEEEKMIRKIVENRYKSNSLEAAKAEVARFYEMQPPEKSRGCLMQTDALVRGLLR